MFGRFVDPIRKLGDTPLKPCFLTHIQLLFIYLSAENLVDSPDTYGMSPLMIASQKGYTRLVSIIIVPFCTSAVIVKLNSPKTNLQNKYHLSTLDLKHGYCHGSNQFKFYFLSSQNINIIWYEAKQNVLSKTSTFPLMIGVQKMHSVMLLKYFVMMVIVYLFSTKCKPFVVYQYV